MCESLKGYIKTLEDAYLIIHAARLRLIKTIDKRLSDEEKRNIDSGKIYVFFETPNGIKRWTDGMFWSPSRVKGPFLDYEIIDNPALKKIYTTSYGTASSHEYRAATKPLVLRKRTLSLKYSGVHYHIIAYFREGISYGSVSRYTFFQKLSKSLIENKDLLSDEFVEKFFKIDDKTLEKYNLVRATKETMKVDLDYESLEKIAVDVLMDLVKKRNKQEAVLKSMFLKDKLMSDKGTLTPVSSKALREEKKFYSNQESNSKYLHENNKKIGEIDKYISNKTEQSSESKYNDIPHKNKTSLDIEGKSRFLHERSKLLQQTSSAIPDKEKHMYIKDQVVADENINSSKRDRVKTSTNMSSAENESKTKFISGKDSIFVSDRESPGKLIHEKRQPIQEIERSVPIIKNIISESESKSKFLQDKIKPGAGVIGKHPLDRDTVSEKSSKSNFFREKNKVVTETESRSKFLSERAKFLPSYEDHNKLMPVIDEFIPEKEDRKSFKPDKQSNKIRKGGKTKFSLKKNKLLPDKRKRSGVSSTKEDK
ncbi:Gluconate transport inducer 1 [Cucumispora dikerogammari]|nr:Gluconate transport inducer 1 [Cucumispora dikerogammari]